jgi:DEAD/DEAH box helicase domain-containing protein
VASARQRAGRAGRGLTESLVIYIPHDDPLEQFMAREPDRLWNGPAEPARIDLHNPYIERSHLLCAASERALSPSELEAYSSTSLSCAEGLERAGELRFQAGRFFYPSHESPASNVQIRGTSGDEFRLMVNGEVIGTMEYWRALMECFPGGVYLHRGRSYVVEHLNLPGRMVELRSQDVAYGTQSHVQSTIRPLVEYFREGDFTMHRVEVTHLVTGYKVTGFRRGVEESHHELELPPYKIETSAVRIEVPDLVPDDDGIAALHAVEHALLVIAPLLAGCDRQDLGSTWYLLEPTVLRPAIYLFDSIPGGIGLCEQLVHERVQWLNTALELLRSCDCEGGCPNCLLLTRCPYGNDSLSKSGGILLLESIRARLG